MNLKKKCKTNIINTLTEHIYKRETMKDRKRVIKADADYVIEVSYENADARMLNLSITTYKPLPEQFIKDITTLTEKYTS